MGLDKREMEELLREYPHRRYNILTGEWVLVSPHRAKRPWQGKLEETQPVNLPEYDPRCYLCPSNIRAGGLLNPSYENQFVFINDFSAMHLQTPAFEINENELLKAQSEPGICKVICFSPRHDLTLPELELGEIEKLIEVWTDEYKTLGGNEKINYVQIFENKGEVMGCSNPHPHGQIWAEKNIPVEPAKEIEQMKKYYAEKGKSILSDYLELELKEEKRIIIENEDFAALVPFWAVWPFETIIISKRHIGNLTEFTNDEKKSFAETLKELTVKYDNLFNTSFPYSAGIHQTPTDGADYDEFHFHMHFYPPLLRSALVKKFMVGYEMLANPQRDITPEASAGILNSKSSLHYKLNKKELKKEINNESVK